jgi:hypothetical protein
VIILNLINYLQKESRKVIQLFPPLLYKYFYHYISVYKPYSNLLILSPTYNMPKTLSIILKNHNFLSNSIHSQAKINLSIKSPYSKLSILTIILYSKNLFSLKKKKKNQLKN